MYSPLISIMIPAFNAQSTIKRALQSLVNQSYKNWECIVVDDGSVDDTAAIVVSVGDARIKLFRLDRNMGRGFARQYALAKCTGDFVGMLDADDWYYSDKLTVQVDFLEEHPEVSIVSCGMVVTSADGNVSGVRSVAATVIANFCVPGVVPIPHAPTLYKRLLAVNESYDASFFLAQDVDFLRRIMMGQKYALLDYVGYVYEEAASQRPLKLVRAHYYCALGYLKFLKSYPLLSIKNAALEIMKIIRVIAYIMCGRFESLLHSRSLAPSTLEVEKFNQMKNNLSASLA